MAGASRVIVIAVDGSKHSEEAFAWYINNIKKDADVVKVVHCPDFHVQYSFGMKFDEKSMQELTEKMKTEQNKVDMLKNQYMEKLREAQVPGEAIILSGEKPGEAILKIAEQNNANMIVCGTRGLGGLKALFIGSVSKYLLQHAKCPVVVVRDD